jgi:rhodanese-related sulfurtransferase
VAGDSSLDRFLRRARSGLTRLNPADAHEAVKNGAVLIDTRPEFRRRADGEIPGAIVVERNDLEWRLHPASSGRIPEAVDLSVRWVVFCDEGYASSLAASTLQALGLQATDVVGGFRAWRDAGLPVTRPDTPTAPRLAPISRSSSAGDLG